MTNADILRIAMQQSAIDSNCHESDFLSTKNKVVLSQKNDFARKYLELPFQCDLVSYGHNIVASVSPELVDITTAYINKYPVIHCFETPNLLALAEKLKPYTLSPCYMAEYFLPDVHLLPSLTCNYDVRLLEPADFSAFYLPQWSNALCEKRKYLDVLAFGAFDGTQLIGLAGCSADCDSMWQIGIDVLPANRHQGIAAALTSALAAEVLQRGIVPFYCCAWSNIHSARTAIKSGFRPAWVQLTAKPDCFVSMANQ